MIHLVSMFLMQLNYPSCVIKTYDHLFSTAIFFQSGCCKPPMECNFTYVRPTTWTKPDSFSSTNLDCTTWSNDANALCYSCQSCKAGFLESLKADWKKVAVVNIVFLIFLIIVYSIGCCAFRNNRAENKGHPQWRP